MAFARYPSIEMEVPKVETNKASITTASEPTKQTHIGESVIDSLQTDKIDLAEALGKTSGQLSFAPEGRIYPASPLTQPTENDAAKSEEVMWPQNVTPRSDLLQKYDISAHEREVGIRQGSEEHQSLEPLNGKTARLHAFTGFLVIFNCWGFSNSWGVLQAYYEHYYLPNNSASTIAWIGSTQLALVFGLGVPVGRLVDKGYFRIMLHCGSLLSVVAIFMSSFCTQWWSLWLTQGLLTGVGMGMVFCSGVVALMTWFDETRMAAAMGLGAAGSCVGGIVYVLLLRHFLLSNGFATTMRIIGGVLAVTILPANLVYRVRGKENAWWPRGQADSSGQHHAGQTSNQSVLALFASPAYLLAAFGMFFAFLGVYFGFVYLVTYGVTILHLSNTAATNLLIFMLAANLPGRFVPALISDRCIGPLNTIVPAMVLSSACIWLWVASSSDDGSNRASLTVIACFYGFVSAGVQVLYAPAVYSFCVDTGVEHSRYRRRRASPSTGASSTDVSSTESGLGQEEVTKKLATDRLGLKAGGIFTLVGIACLIGTPIGGALISYRLDRGMGQPYLGAQCFAGVSLLLGGLLLLGSRVAKVGWGPQRA